MGPTPQTALALSKAMTKILVVENHADMREILVRIFDLMGFTAITSKNGREGVEKALAEKTRSDRDGHHDARNLGMGGDSNPAQQSRNKGCSVLAATVLSGHPIFRDALALVVMTISSSHLR